MSHCIPLITHLGILQADHAGKIASEDKVTSLYTMENDGEPNLLSR